MKYLKTYKIYENGYINQKSSPLEIDVVSDVHDMLLDLKDDEIGYVFQVSSRTNKTQDYHWYDYNDFAQYGGLTYSETQVSSLQVSCSIPRPDPTQNLVQRSFHVKIIKQVFERMMNYCEENGLKYNLWACPSSSRSVGRYCVRGQNVNQDPITVVDLDKDIYENSRLEIFIFK